MEDEFFFQTVAATHLSRGIAVPGWPYAGVCLHTLRRCPRYSTRVFASGKWKGFGPVDQSR